MLAFAGIDPGEFVEVGDLAGDLYWKIADIKPRDPFHAALPRQDRPAELLFANSVRTHNPNSGDHRPLHQHVWPSPRFYAFVPKLARATGRCGYAPIDFTPRSNRAINPISACFPIMKLSPHASRPLHLRSFLPLQMQLLQLRLRRVRPRQDGWIHRAIASGDSSRGESGREL